MTPPTGTAPGSPFAFAICQPGAERWLKQHVASLRPDLHAGFQRPGLLTFRATGNLFGPDETLPTPFARAWGCSGGPMRETAPLLDLAASLGARHLFLGHRDAGTPGDEPPARLAAAREHARDLEARLRETGAFTLDAPTDGDIVLDVICWPEEPALVGWHRAGPGRHRYACGRFPVELPASAPSRSYLKVAEGLLWAGIRLEPGVRVLEIGAAPGGGTLAFVERGARVVAVDSQPLDPALATHPSVTFLRRAVREVHAEDLPTDVAWIACDANIAPDHALPAVLRLARRFPATLRGLLLTLKLNDDATVAALPRHLDLLRANGFDPVRATQLPSNRQDLFVHAALPPPARRSRRGR